MVMSSMKFLLLSDSTMATKLSMPDVRAPGLQACDVAALITLRVVVGRPKRDLALQANRAPTIGRATKNLQRQPGQPG
jgi:hypothetical protein